MSRTPEGTSVTAGAGARGADPVEPSGRLQGQGEPAPSGREQPGGGEQAAGGEQPTGRERSARREQGAKVDPEDWAASSGSDDERFLRERPPHW